MAARRANQSPNPNQKENSHMAVKTEGEKTAMLRAGKPGMPISAGKSAGSQNDGLPFTRKASGPK